ncbi:HDOD domain-containing protein [bacterium]|nr:HDOD domain-containing protein [bacterium]
MSMGIGGDGKSGPKRVMVVDRERFSDLICKMLSGKYQTTVATDGLQAVRALKESPPDVIVVEMSIPGSGLRLAELVGISPKFNHIPVVLTSANPSMDIVLKAKDAGVSSYLAKPFRPSELASRIEQALTEPVVAPEPSAEVSPEEKGAAVGAEGTPAAVEGARRSIRDRVKKIDGLPVFPATHAEIMKLAKSENATSEALAEQIKMDPSMLATILKLVNSAYYGLRKKVDSLKVAVSLLGFEEIANLVMSAQVFQGLGGYKNKLGLDLKGFWRHSVGAGFVARSVAKKLQTEAETAFLAGMLHDIGKVVLDRFFPDYYIQVMGLVKGGEMSIGQAEEEVLGLTHAEVGGQLAAEWKFSENLQNVIMYHHAPEVARRYQRLVGLVHLSDGICRT